MMILFINHTLLPLLIIVNKKKNYVGTNFFFCNNIRVKAATPQNKLKNQSLL